MNRLPPTPEDLLRLAMGSPGFISAMFRELTEKQVAAVYNRAFALACSLESREKKPPSDLPPALRRRCAWNN